MINRSKQFVSIIYISIVKHICPNLQTHLTDVYLDKKKLGQISTNMGE